MDADTWARVAKRCPPGVVALVAVVVVLGLLWQRTEVDDFSVFDQPFYLGIAHDLVETGRFTDGFMFAQPGMDGLRPLGMRFAPLYPALVAAGAELDPGLRQGMDCLVATGGKILGCPAKASGLRALQFVELVGVFWLVWWMATAAGGPEVGWMSLLVSFGSATLLLRSVNFLMTEMTCLVFTTGATAAGLQALRGWRRLRWSAAAGALMALAALTRPACLYAIPACAVGALALGRLRALRPVMAMSLAAALVLAPWVIRNKVELGRAALIHGYDSHTLVQRIAFDTMDWHEYGMAYVCWLPDGNEIGRALDGAGACDRFGWDEHANSFYVLGLRHMLDETLAASGGYEHHLGYLLHHYIFRLPLTHAMVSVPLALRGAYVAHWWGFVLLIACVTWLIIAFKRGDSGDPDFDRRAYLVIALPAFFLLVFNAWVAVNQVRYNLMLIPAYAIAGGLSVRWVAKTYGRRLSYGWPFGRVG